MEGAEANPSGMLTEHSGVIPRAVADIFRRLEGGECADAFTVKVSVLELYNEELSDLLTADEKKLSIFEDNSGCVIPLLSALFSFSGSRGLCT